MNDTIAPLRRNSPTREPPRLPTYDPEPTRNRKDHSNLVPVSQTDITSLQNDIIQLKNDMKQVAWERDRLNEKIEILRRTNKKMEEENGVQTLNAPPRKRFWKWSILFLQLSGSRRNFCLRTIVPVSIWRRACSQSLLDHRGKTSSKASRWIPPPIKTSKLHRRHLFANKCKTSTRISQLLRPRLKLKRRSS